MWNISLPILLFGLLTVILGKRWQLKSQHITFWLIMIVFLYYLSAWLMNLPGWNMTDFQIGIVGFVQSAILTAVILLFCFYRDPDRQPPNDQGIILSPADGKISYVKKIEKDEFPFATKKGKYIPLSELTQHEFIHVGGYQIGISMNFLNVHVNRAPISGKISKLKKIHGRFESLKNIKSLLVNERRCTIIKSEKIEVCVVQIASRLVRKIVSFIEQNNYVLRGQRIGMIRFGSQVDIIIPVQKGMEIKVKEGDEVKAGITIVGKYGQDI